MSRHGRVAMWVALVVGCGVACARGPSETRSANLAAAGARGANVLLVTIDTLRRDRLGAYGSAARLTPVIDEVAGRGVRYERAYAHSPMTLPSHASILTGRTPVGHGLRNNGTYRLDASVPTLATALASHGYRTGAFVGAFVLDARYGLGRGFDVYDDRLPGRRGETTFRYPERAGAEVVQAAGDWITSGGSEPWFAWVHLFDPHAPYAAPPEFAAGRAAYDGEVAYADAMVGRLLGRLTTAGLEGASGHSLTTTPAGDREVYFEAMDAALSRGWAPLTGVATARWKLIDLPERELYDLVADAAEARNLATVDPTTADSLDRRRRTALAAPAAKAPAASRDAEGERRLRALGYAASAGAGSGGGPPRQGLDPKRLVAVHEQFTAALEAFSSGHQDVALREFLDVLRERPEFTAARTTAASALIERGRAREAVTLLDDAPAEARQAPELLARLGVARREAGDLQGARAALESAQASGWQNPEVLNDLGVVYARLGRTDEARAAFTSLVETAPHAADVWNNLGVLELSVGRRAEAVAAFRQAVDADPAFGDAWQGLGAALVERDPAAAIEAWRRAERLLPRDFDLLYNLGMLLAAGARPSEAAPYLARFVKEAPAAKYARDRATVASTLRRVSR